MPDVDTRLLRPRDIVLIVEGDSDDPEDVIRVPIPGELSLDEAFDIEELRAEIWRSNLERQGTVDPKVERSSRESLNAAYRKSHDLVQSLARRRNPDAPDLDLTVTMLEAVLAMLVEPAERGVLLARAYASALGLEVAEDPEFPLAGGSPGKSSPSGGDSEPSPATGTRSRGASGSRTARRSAKKN